MRDAWKRSTLLLRHWRLKNPVSKSKFVYWYCPWLSLPSTVSIGVINCWMRSRICAQQPRLASHWSTRAGIVRNVYRQPKRRNILVTLCKLMPEFRSCYFGAIRLRRQRLCYPAGTNYRIRGIERDKFEIFPITQKGSIVLLISRLTNTSRRATIQHNIRHDEWTVPVCKA